MRREKEGRGLSLLFSGASASKEAAFWASVGRPCPNEGIDHWSLNDGAFEKHGRWGLVCVGPNRAYLSLDFPPPLSGSDVPYDATNGMRSFGNILRTQKNAPVLQ